MMIIYIYSVLSVAEISWICGLGWMEIDKIPVFSSSSTIFVRSTIVVHQTVNLLLHTRFPLLIVNQCASTKVHGQQVFHSNPSTIPVKCPHGQTPPCVRNNISTDRTTMIDDSCAKLIIPATIKININFWPREEILCEWRRRSSRAETSSIHHHPSWAGTLIADWTGLARGLYSSIVDWLNVSKL